MWFLKPKHTLQTVAERLLEGLEDGTIVLDNDVTSEHTSPNLEESGRLWPAATDAAQTDSDSERLSSHIH